MPGASGAESKAVCTEAGMFALRERRTLFAITASKLSWRSCQDDG